MRVMAWRVSNLKPHPTLSDDLPRLAIGRAVVSLKVEDVEENEGRRIMGDLLVLLPNLVSSGHRLSDACFISFSPQQIHAKVSVS